MVETQIYSLAIKFDFTHSGVHPSRLVCPNKQIAWIKPLAGERYNFTETSAGIRPRRKLICIATILERDGRWTQQEAVKEEERLCQREMAAVIHENELDRENG